MKFLSRTWQFLKKVNNSKIAKTLTGIAVVGIGAAVNLIPAVGPLAGQVIMSAGSTIIVWGATDKIVRAKEGENLSEKVDIAFSHEKNLINKLRGADVPTKTA